MKRAAGEPGAVAVAGATLAYTTEGNGRPMLVVGSSIYYPRTFSRRLRQSCRLVCADLPHFVRLDPRFSLERISFEFYAECIEAVRLAAGLERVVIAGHSHHGNVALEYARRYPGQVSHVVLIGSPPVDVALTVAAARRYWEAHASATRKAQLQARRRSLGQDGLASLPPEQAYIAQYVADAPLYWHDPAYDAAWLWADMAFGMPGIHAFRDLFREYVLRRDPESLRAPVLVVMGRHDYAVPHTLWADALPALDDVTFRVLERSGHTPQLEEPEAFDRLLLDWLDDRRGAPQVT
jgi:proline iminopeptidase